MLARISHQVRNPGEVHLCEKERTKALFAALFRSVGDPTCPTLYRAENSAKARFSQAPSRLAQVGACTPKTPMLYLVNE